MKNSKFKMQNAKLQFPPAGGWAKCKKNKTKNLYLILNC